MLKNKTLEKLLAIILIFTLTSTNFAFVTKAYASSFTEALFGNKSDTGSKNVEFDAYFEAEDEEITSVISDVNNKDLAISMNLSVENSGYLKDAEIKILEAEEGKGLNFNLTELEELPEFVQSIEENSVVLDQIGNYDDEVSIHLPIEFKNEKYFDESDLSKEFLVALSGIYLDEKGNEKEISKEVKLELSWKDEREVNVETEVEKYIDFGEGVIVQSKVLVDNSTELNTLPVKETELTISVPSFQGVAPSNVFVVANSTMGTNGESVGEVSFDESNWEYDSEENKLTINVSNKKKLVVINEFEDEYLQDAEKELVEEERYYNQSGVDEYIVTYTYNDAVIPEEEVEINSDIEAKMVLFSGAEKEDNINIITKENNYENKLEENIGNIVSLNTENKTQDISKAYFYSNLNEAKYDIELNSETVINVAYKDIVSSLEIEDSENVYVGGEENRYDATDIYYKEVSVSKQNIVEMLGEEGEIKIFDLSGNYLTSIKSAYEENEDGNITVSFDYEYSKLRFEISKPIAEGNLIISNRKAISNVGIDREAYFIKRFFESKL